MEKGNAIIIGIVIFISFYLAYKIWEKITTSKSNKIQEKTIPEAKHEEKKTEDPHAKHDDHGHHENPKKDRSTTSKIFSWLGIVLLFILVIVFVVNGYDLIRNKVKSSPKPRPHYVDDYVVVKRKTLDIRSTTYNDNDTIHFMLGYKVELESTTVAFCVKNRDRQEACGLDPYLPNSGELVQILYFKSEYSNERGIIKLVIYKKIKKLVYY